MDLRPLHDRLIVQRLNDDSTQGVDYVTMKEDDVLEVGERSL